MTDDTGVKHVLTCVSSCLLDNAVICQLFSPSSCVAGGGAVAALFHVVIYRHSISCTGQYQGVGSVDDVS